MGRRRIGGRFRQRGTSEVTTSASPFDDSSARAQARGGAARRPLDTQWLTLLICGVGFRGAQATGRWGSAMESWLHWKVQSKTDIVATSWPRGGDFASPTHHIFLVVRVPRHAIARYINQHALGRHSSIGWGLGGRRTRAEATAPGARSKASGVTLHRAGFRLRGFVVRRGASSSHPAYNV